MFKKGQSGNPAGKKPGTKNRNCFSPVFWFNLMEERSRNLSDEKVVEISLRALALIMPKISNVPATPADSVSNAASAYQTMNEVLPQEVAPATTNGAH